MFNMETDQTFYYIFCLQSQCTKWTVAASWFYSSSSLFRGR